jgi:hypothetical protein
MPHRANAPAGYACLSILLNIACYARPVILPGNTLVIAFGIKMPCNRVVIMMPKHLY